MEKFQQAVEEDKPEVGGLINGRRYVDDCGDSRTSKDKCVVLAAECDEVFNRVGLTCKSWTMTGDDPDEKVSKDGVSIGVGGLKWFLKLDLIEVKIPKLHFGKKKLGRLNKNIKFCDGKFEERIEGDEPGAVIDKNRDERYEFGSFA